MNQTCTHHRAVFCGFQRWGHEPEIVLFTCPDCKGTFALETLVALWREQDSMAPESVGWRRYVATAEVAV